MKHTIKHNGELIASGYMSNTSFFPLHSGPLPNSLQHLLENARIPLKNVWYIYNIYTKESHRRKGYCKKLIQKMIDHVYHSLVLLHIRYKGDTIPTFHKCYKHNDFKLYRPYDQDDVDPSNPSYKIALFYRIN